MPSDPLPLEGVRVVDLTRLLPGAYCTLVLADLGADVVKVEDPNGGDLMRTLPPYVGGLSVYHHALNRNKRSVTLDLRAGEAADLLDRLVAGADVVVESFRPKTARRLRVSADDLRPRHPRLVHCSLTGFGQGGPYAERAAHDLDFVALAGLFEIDQPDATNLRVPRLLVADVGGAWAAVAGILAALFQRERIGRGSGVDIAMLDVATSWLTFPAAAIAIGSTAPVAPPDERRRGARSQPPRAFEPLPIAGDAACYNLYETADGRHVALAAIEQKFWRTFCERIGRSDFVPAQFAPGEQARMRAAIAATFRQRTLADWLALFSDVDICLAPVKTVDEALADPHLASRGQIGLSGDSRFLRSPIVFRAASAGTSDRPVIEAARPLGADTDDVFAAAGLDEATLAALRASRVI